MADRHSRWQVEPKERRRLLRLPVQVPAMLVSSSLGRVKAMVTDLSQAGCRIESRARCHRGDHLVLTIGSIAPRIVTTAWWREGEQGLAFAEPLAWAVVADIVRSDPARPADEGEPAEPVPIAPLFGLCHP